MSHKLAVRGSKGYELAFFATHFQVDSRQTDTSAIRPQFMDERSVANASLLML